ncbi:glutathione S-transferase [Yoonia tamlensis]|uniref:Glutathione S-transferase n=1 Tax=Yoonia tamlensis TaxID=390270 RepID=A0A1I6GWV8_9RHOB|nr:glutathione S-transferase [Yoonia tamlensis]SFR46547.1 glutathione S-transferase [Yoonia tamlensis]
MTYQLYIGDRTFSSWSLRGWLMLEKFGLDYNTNLVGLYAGTYREELAHLAPARTVPAMQTPEGYVLTDSLAMGETLVERHPDIDLYPRDGAARALARTITHEMHSGFMALRDACPNMITHVWEGFKPSDAVLSDLARIEELWALARSRHGQNGPWLFGEYSLADVFYAPVALRITAYDLPVSADAQNYVNAHLSDPAFLAWREASKSETYEPWPYPMDLGRKPWPGDVS